MGNRPGMGQAQHQAKIEADSSVKPDSLSGRVGRQSLRFHGFKLGRNTKFFDTAVLLNY